MKELMARLRKYNMSQVARISGCDRSTVHRAAHGSDPHLSIATELTQAMDIIDANPKRGLLPRSPKR